MKSFLKSFLHMNSGPLLILFVILSAALAALYPVNVKAAPIEAKPQSQPQSVQTVVDPTKKSRPRVRNTRTPQMLN